jgi:hypothetical protein
MRRFVRHPSCIPIELSVARTHNSNAAGQYLHNISSGGFACAVEEPLPVGCSVHLRIPMIWPDYRGSGVVAWCRKATRLYEIGIRFSEQHLFKAKMVEQLAQIEQYRLQVQQSEGRALSSEQAAIEWIELFAKDFSDSFLEPDEKIGS